ncbi:MAG: hypothetical protein KKG60_03280 [Nanoarchaeota archaeon]|nr:hypothetical protein [Nanoarchaeota archaeon]
MKILEKTENPLLSRTKLKIDLDHSNQPTPKKEDIISGIAKTLNTKPGLIKLEHIYTKFSSGKSRIIAYVYKDEKTLKSIQKNKKKGKKTETKKEGSEEQQEVKPESKKE